MTFKFGDSPFSLVPVSRPNNHTFVIVKIFRFSFFNLAKRFLNSIRSNRSGVADEITGMREVHRASRKETGKLLSVAGDIGSPVISISSIIIGA